MNKVITDGLVLMPPEFAGGLDVWSSQDGTPGQDTYDGAVNAAFVPADADFGGCMEMLKTQSVQKLRWFGDTPIVPGCYLKITARVKAVSGNLPDVRIAGWAGGAGGTHVGGLTEVGPSTTLTTYGEVVEISAIVGTGSRTGVDMEWGSAPIFGHFGLDLTGSNSGVIRIDDIQIEDITSAFLRTMMDWVDVKDFGAIGDGVADDQPAFEAADAAANGRRVLISAGTYFLNDHVTFENPVRFEGTVTMPTNKRMVFKKNFDLPTYINAFGDEKLALEKALQTLFSYSDHSSLDMCGRRVDLFGPIDVQAAVATQDTFESSRRLINGQLNLHAHSDWDTETVTSAATYATGDPKTLTAVANVANIIVGSLVTGAGVGREIYVRSKNVGAGTVQLSQPLYNAVGTQTYTFTRFKYALDFSGFVKMSRFTLESVDLQCNGVGSGMLLPPDGNLFHVRDCYIGKPKDRGLTSHGVGCQDIKIDRNQFVSNEQGVRSQDRTSIGFNTNKNDAKIRDNHVARFKHFGVLGGVTSIVSGNHWYQGDSEVVGVRGAGLVLTHTNTTTTISGNYIDNCYIEMTNEHHTNVTGSGGLPFGGVTISDNIFLAHNVLSSFNYIVVTPYGSGTTVKGLNVQGNVFRVNNGNIDRIEGIDTSFADINYASVTNITFAGNTYNGVTNWTQNPVTVEHTQNTDDNIWSVDFSKYLPFDGFTQVVESVIPHDRILQPGGATLYSSPFTLRRRGPAENLVEVRWESACHGKVWVTARCDKPH